MSFFKDFKDDLNQAVNELMPEENAAQAAPQMVDTISEPVAEAATDDMSFAELFKTLDANIAAAPETVETVSEPQAQAPKVEIPVYEEPAAPVAEPVAPAVEPVFAPEPVKVEEPKAPVEPVFAPEPVKVEEPKAPVEPVFAPEPVKVEEPKAPVTPVFAETTGERPAPINTIAEGVNEVGVIPMGMTVVGNITSNGSLDIMGTVKGNVTVAGKLNITGNIEGDSKAEEVFADGARIIGEVISNGTIKVGQSSVIKGNLSASSAVLAGAVKGDIDVKGPVILDSTAIIMGNIKSKSIQINNGAAIEGLCSQCYAEVSPASFFTEG